MTEEDKERKLLIRQLVAKGLPLYAIARSENMTISEVEKLLDEMYEQEKKNFDPMVKIIQSLDIYDDLLAEIAIIKIETKDTDEKLKLIDQQMKIVRAKLDFLSGGGVKQKFDYTAYMRKYMRNYRKKKGG